MTRKDFELIARVLSQTDTPAGGSPQQRIDHWGEDRDGLIEAFVRELRTANTRFDADTFRRAARLV